MAPFFAARSQRGAGTVRMQRMVYELDQNVAILAETTTLVLCGAAHGVLRLSRQTQSARGPWNQGD